VQLRVIAVVHAMKRRRRERQPEVHLEVRVQEGGERLAHHHHAGDVRERRAQQRPGHADRDAVQHEVDGVLTPGIEPRKLHGLVVHGVKAPQKLHAVHRAVHRVAEEIRGDEHQHHRERTRAREVQRLPCGGQHQQHRHAQPLHQHRVGDEQHEAQHRRRAAPTQRLRREEGLEGNEEARIHRQEHDAADEHPGHESVALEAAEVDALAALRFVLHGQLVVEVGVFERRLHLDLRHFHWRHGGQVVCDELGLDARLGDV